MTGSFPPMDFTRFQWRKSPDNPNLYIREAWGAEAVEDFWHRFNHGEQMMRIGLKVLLRVPFPPDMIVSCARQAWKSIRFQVPTLAAQTAYDSAGNTLITYLSASSHEVDSWAQRTLRISQLPLDDLQYDLSKRHIPEENGDQTFLYVVPNVADASFGILFHSIHTLFDGAGVKTIMNKYFTLLAEYLMDNSARPPLPWGQEGRNLIPSASEILGPDEHREGEIYEQTLSAVMGDLTSVSHQHGFRPRNFGPGPTRRLAHYFSQAQTETIIRRAREHGFTVNHLVHAAVTMVAAFDNPPTTSTPADAVFVYYGHMDARERLAAPYSSRGGYPGYCLAASAIQIPVALFPPGGIALDEAVKLLIDVAGVMKAEYTKQKAYPSLLAIQAQAAGLVLDGMRSGAQPPPPWMGPWYSGDGVGETYLDPIHTDKHGQDVLEITDLSLSLTKTDPGPYFRALSWRGKMQLSVDANEVAMPVHVVQGFLDKLAQLLLAFASSRSTGSSPVNRSAKL